MFCYTSLPHLSFQRTRKNCRILSILPCLIISFIVVTNSPQILAASTVTTLTTSSNLLVAGTTVTLTATVTSNGNPVSRGTVRFCNASVPYCDDITSVLGTAQLTSNGTATVNLRLGIGSYSVKAMFRATLSLGSSSSQTEAIQVLGKFPSAISFVNSGQPGNYKVTATVIGHPNGVTKPAPTGTVSIVDPKGKLLGSTAVGSSAIKSELLPMQTVATGGGVGGLAIGDFNSDGILDFAVADQNIYISPFTGDLSIFLGDPAHTGQYLSPMVYPTAGAAGPPVVADFNGDGALDIIVGDLSQSTDSVSRGFIGVFLGDLAHPGKFLPETLYPAGILQNFYGPYAWQIAVGDFNGDGLPDLVVGQYPTNFDSTPTINVLLNDPSHPGQFLPYTSLLPAGGVGVTSMTTGDFNHDGIDDLVITTNYYTTSGYPAAPGDSIEVFLSDFAHPGQFLPPVSYMVGEEVAGIVTSDFNRDGTLDLAVANLGAPPLSENSQAAVSILLGDPSTPGSFLTPVSYPARGNTFGSFPLALGDFNGDGITDVAIGEFDATILLGDPTHPGTLLPSTSFPLGGYVPFLGAADLNGDGMTDLAVGVTNGADNSTYFRGTVFSQISQTSTESVSGISLPNPQSNYVRGIYSGDRNYLGSHTGWANIEMPTIGSATVSNITTDSATISWTSNVPTYGVVDYGPTSALGEITPWPSSPSFTHTIVLTGLTPLTTYNYEVRSVVLFDDGTHWSVTSPLAPFSTIRLPSTTTLHLSSTSVNLGTPVSLTATVVSQGTPVSPGQVSFCSGIPCTSSNMLGVASLTPTGTIPIKARLGIGSHNIYAVFNGTSPFTPSISAPQALKVCCQFPTAITIGSLYGTFGRYGLVAGITADGGQGVDPPNGSVSFFDVTRGQVLATSSQIFTQSSFDFRSPLLTPTGITAGKSIATADLNGDGILDAVVTSGPVNVLLGSPTHPGQFVTTTLPLADTKYSGVAVADFNGDGAPDIALTNNGSVGNVTLLFADLSHPGQFLSPVIVPIGNSSANQTDLIVTGDFNRDGLPDLAARTINGAQTTLAILLNNPVHPGTFNPVTPLAVNVQSSLATGDFNGDGVPDLVAGYSGSQGTLVIVFGDPVNLGNFLPNPSYYTLPAAPDSIAVADLNGDGISDLAMAVNGEAGVLLGDPTHPGQFSTLATYQTGGNASSIAIGDVTGDNLSDLVAVNSENLVVLPGDPSNPGQYQSSTTFISGTVAAPLALADFNGDSIMDAMIPGSSEISVLLGKRPKFTNLYVWDVSTQALGDYVEARYSGDSIYSGGRSCVIAFGLGSTGQAPVVTNITVSAISKSSATISWTSSIPTNGTVNYGTTATMGTLTPWEQIPTTTHSFQLVNLKPKTLYYFQVQSTAFFDSCTHWSSTSPQQSLMTLAQ